MSEENKKIDEKAVERSMYADKSSKNPKKPLIWGIIFAVVCIVYGIYEYFKILKWEEEGGTYHMNRLGKLLYDIGGAALILAFFVGTGILLAYAGYKSYKNKKGE